MYPIYEPAEFVLFLSLFKQVVSPLKDVEGLHFKFHYNLYHKYVHFFFDYSLVTLSIKKSIRFVEPKSLLASVMPTPISTDSEEPPAGTVKSIIPCTPLAIVKCLEFVGIYNKILPYGDRAYGKTITVINRYAHHR